MSEAEEMKMKGHDMEKKGTKNNSIKTEASGDDFELKNIWPHLSKAINCLVKKTVR